MPPKPTMPSVLPAISRPDDSGPRGHFPAATSAVAKYVPRSRTIATPITYSATASALAPVAGMTAMSRAAQAATSMLSSPTPSRPTTRRRGAAASSSTLTCVRLRTISASASMSFALSSSRRSTRSAVVLGGVVRGERGDRRLVHELADHDAHGYGPQVANRLSMSANALNSSALPNGSRKNIVACSPGSPSKRT